MFPDLTRHDFACAKYQRNLFKTFGSVLVRAFGNTMSHLTHRRARGCGPSVALVQWQCHGQHKNNDLHTKICVMLPGRIPAARSRRDGKTLASVQREERPSHFPNCPNFLVAWRFCWVRSNWADWISSICIQSRKNCSRWSHRLGLAFRDVDSCSITFWLFRTCEFGHHGLTWVRDFLRVWRHHWELRLILLYEDVRWAAWQGEQLFLQRQKDVMKRRSPCPRSLYETNQTCTVISSRWRRKHLQITEAEKPFWVDVDSAWRRQCRNSHPALCGLSSNVISVQSDINFSGVIRGWHCCVLVTQINCRNGYTGQNGAVAINWLREFSCARTTNESSALGVTLDRNETNQFVDPPADHPTRSAINNSTSLHRKQFTNATSRTLQTRLWNLSQHSVVSPTLSRGVSVLVTSPAKQTTWVSRTQIPKLGTVKPRV